MRNFYLSFIVLSCILLGVVWGFNVSAISNEMPELYIKAVNPGYSIDGVSNVGEMIEIGKNSSEKMISLAGVTVGYTNSSGNYSIIFEFPENSWITGESILLRLASSPESELASGNYSKTLAFKGGIDLKVRDEIVDSVCWTGKGECYKDFKSANPTTLVRNIENGIFEHLLEYTPDYLVDNYWIEPKEEEGYGMISGHCRGLEFSELLSYYETSKSEQFIEIHNYSAEQVLLDGCAIRYKNKNYELKGIAKADEYKVYYPEGFSLTKNPTNSNLLEIIDVDGTVVDNLIYPNGQRKSTSYALIGYDGFGKEIWKVTYAPTPGEPNNYQEFKTCEEGKVINEVTGNCVKAVVVKEKICEEGQYLNILTGRCKKIETATTKTCKEGYYLNPETGRCKRIVENNGADYNVVPEQYEQKSSFVALYAIIGVIVVGLTIVVYEFRNEIGKIFKKIFRINR